MNTSDVVAVCVTAVAVAFIAVLWLGGRKLLRALDGIVWNKADITISGPSLRIRQAPVRAAASGPVPNGHAPARAPESHAERPAIAPVPQDGDMTRAVAAKTLGVSERSLRRHAGEWGIEEIAVPGRATLCTAESVNRYLAARNGEAQ